MVFFTVVAITFAEDRRVWNKCPPVEMSSSLWPTWKQRVFRVRTEQETIPDLVSLLLHPEFLGQGTGVYNNQLDINHARPGRGDRLDGHRMTAVALFIVLNKENDTMNGQQVLLFFNPTDLQGIT